MWLCVYVLLRHPARHPIISYGSEGRGISLHTKTHVRPIVVLETVGKYAFAISSPSSITMRLVRNISLDLYLCRNPPGLSVLKIERTFFE